MRQWRPRLEEVNREVRQFGVAVPGGVEHVGLRARKLHETGSWLILTDCSNPFNTVKRTAMLAEAANCVPALTPFVAKYYGTRSAGVFFRMDSGETSPAPGVSSREIPWAGNGLSGVTTGAEAFPR